MAKRPKQRSLSDVQAAVDRAGSARRSFDRENYSSVCDGDDDVDDDEVTRRLDAAWLKKQTENIDY